jgi:hypothetical protein
MTDEITEFPTKLNALPEEARADKRESLKARKVFAAVFSPFVRAMHECMNAYREARAQGLERADAAKGIEHVLREMWPKPASKFGPTCQACGDTGYEEYICRQWARCERHSCQRLPPMGQMRAAQLPAQRGGLAAHLRAGLRVCEGAGLCARGDAEDAAGHDGDDRQGEQA